MNSSDSDKICKRAISITMVKFIEVHRYKQTKSVLAIVCRNNRHKSLGSQNRETKRQIPGTEASPMTFFCVTFCKVTYSQRWAIDFVLCSKHSKLFGNSRFLELELLVSDCFVVYVVNNINYDTFYLCSFRRNVMEF